MQGVEVVEVSIWLQHREKSRRIADTFGLQSRPSPSPITCPQVSCWGVGHSKGRRAAEERLKWALSGFSGFSGFGAQILPKI
jgi:hypothetical protein